MSDGEKQEGQKTIVSFIAGLLIGGLLVWVFGGTNDTTTAPEGEVVDETTEGVDETTDEANDRDEDETSAGSDSTDEETESQTPTMQTGEGALEVSNQPAGSSVAIEGATFPNDNGWIAVRSYENEQLGNILGAARFSREQGLVPESVPLLVPTVAGRTYAVVFFTEDGDREFNLATDTQVEGVWETFTAQ